MALATSVVVAPALAQSSCSSDGQRAPQGVLERFINADCATCWSESGTKRPDPQALAIDWIVPSAAGQDAPLWAAASRDSLQRLESLALAVPITSAVHPGAGSGAAGAPLARGVKLRVARGVALGGYMGASVELTLPQKKPVGQARIQYPLTAWLVLAQEIRAGEEGSPVERLLVRNALVLTWKSGRRHAESRPMGLPEGSNPQRIRVVAWVQDATGRTLATAASVCVSPPA